MNRASYQTISNIKIGRRPRVATDEQQRLIRKAIAELECSLKETTQTGFDYHLSTAHRAIRKV